MKRDWGVGKGKEYRSRRSAFLVKKRCSLSPRNYIPIFKIINKKRASSDALFCCFTVGLLIGKGGNSGEFFAFEELEAGTAAGGDVGHLGSET